MSENVRKWTWKNWPHAVLWHHVEFKDLCLRHQTPNRGRGVKVTLGKSVENMGKSLENLWEIWQNHEESLVNTVFREDVRALKPWDWCKGVRVMVDLLEALAWENGTKNNGAGDLSCSGWDRGRKRPWSYAAIRNLKPAYPSDPLFGHPPTHQEWLHP